MVPSVLDRSSSPDSETPVRTYRVGEDRDAVRLVFQRGLEYWGVQQTNWADAPRATFRDLALSRSSFRDSSPAIWQRWARKVSTASRPVEPSCEHSLFFDIRGVEKARRRRTADSGARVVV